MALQRKEPGHQKPRIDPANERRGYKVTLSLIGWAE